jgi:MFS transporter, UMF1 family
MNVRAIIAWTLYDFANSSFAAVIFATIYAAYYAMGVVGNDTGACDLWVTATALMTTVGPGMVIWGFVLSVLGNVGYESALVYYNAYLPELAPRSHQGRVSAWGFAVGYAGSIAALVAALPFVRAKSYGGAFLCAAALFGVFSLPAFFLLPQPAARGCPFSKPRAGAGQR